MQCAALTALGMQETAKAVPFLIKVLHHGSYSVAEAAKGLVELASSGRASIGGSRVDVQGDRRSILQRRLMIMKLFLRALQNPKVRVKREVLSSLEQLTEHGLGELKQLRASSHVIPLLSDRDPQVRARAAKLLKGMKDRSATFALMRAADKEKESEESETREAIIDAIASLTDRRSIPLLLAELGKRPTGQVAAALARMGVRKGLDWALASQMNASIDDDDEILTRIPSVRTTLPLLAVLGDRLPSEDGPTEDDCYLSDDLRRAIHHFARSRDLRAVPFLDKALKLSRCDETKAEVRKALAALRGPLGNSRGTKTTAR